MRSPPERLAPIVAKAARMPLLLRTRSRRRAHAEHRWGLLVRRRPLRERGRARTYRSVPLPGLPEADELGLFGPRRSAEGQPANRGTGLGLRADRGRGHRTDDDPQVLSGV